MKNLIIITLTFICCFAFCGLAEAQSSGRDTLPSSDPTEDWDFFGLPFFPEVPTACKYTDIYGVKVGLPISFGEGKDM